MITLEFGGSKPLSRWVVSVCLAALTVACGTTEPTSRPTPKVETTTAAPGWLNVTTAPDGVAVIVDGKRMGSTPLKVQLASGEHIVVFQHEGRNEGPYAVSVTPGETRTMKHRFLATLGGRKEQMIKRYETPGYDHLKACFPSGWRGWVRVYVSYFKGKLFRVRVIKRRATTEIVRCLETNLMGTSARVGLSSIASETIILFVGKPRPRPRPSVTGTMPPAHRTALRALY